MAQSDSGRKRIHDIQTMLESMAIYSFIGVGLGFWTVRSNHQLYGYLHANSTVYQDKHAHAIRYLFGHHQHSQVQKARFRVWT